MLARVDSFVLQGIDAERCEIEVDLVSSNFPRMVVVGLPDAAVKESRERVRSAIGNAGYRWPFDRVTVNLGPAGLRKEGSVYDLPIAVAVLAASGTIRDTEARLAAYLVAGELALDGRVRPVRGATSLAVLARRLGRTGVIVPVANAAEAAIVRGVDVRPVTHLSDVVTFLNDAGEIASHPALDVETLIDEARPAVDFREVRGQEAAKRALTVAAAGGHNVLMIGPAGTGKSMMAKALPGILPPLTADEALEVIRVHSCAGRGGARETVARPVRTPHHTASAASIVGGGSVPRPGEVSLAHRGVLFLDEVPEFSRGVLETLRQPLEDGTVTVARVHGTVRFPARFMLVGAMNPTPKGTVARDAASAAAMERYLARLSGPLIDRIDLHVEVPAVAFRQLTGAPRGADTAALRGRVVDARAVQRARQGALLNAELSGRDLDLHAALGTTATSLLEQAMRELALSARAYDRIRRVARTVADLDGAADVADLHIAEAVQYRLLDRDAAQPA